MKFKVSLSAMLLVLLGSGVLWAGDPWKEKPYAEWTEEEVRKILGKSPWAKVLIRNLSPPSPVPLSESRTPDIMPRQRYSYVLRTKVQWASSRTFREARWRRAQLVGRVTHVVEHRRAEDYIVIWVVPVLLGSWISSGGTGYGSFSERLRPTETPDAYVEPRRSKQKVLPVSVNYLANAFELIFPRYLDGKPIFGPNEKKVRFHCKVMLQLTSQGKSLFQPPNFPLEFKLRVDFDLRKMVRDGKPDL